MMDKKPVFPSYLSLMVELVVHFILLYEVDVWAQILKSYHFVRCWSMRFHIVNVVQFQTRDSLVNIFITYSNFILTEWCTSLSYTIKVTCYIQIYSNCCPYFDDDIYLVAVKLSTLLQGLVIISELLGTKSCPHLL